jgi:hypothetical protein
MNPPPLPSSPVAATPPPPRKSSNSTVWIVVAVVCVALFFGVGIFAAILIPTIGKVRETARRTVDSSNERQILQSTVIWATGHNGALPPARISASGEPGGTSYATVYGVAAALAREGGLNDATMWVSASDTHATAPQPAQLGAVIDASGQLDPAFAQQTSIAWDFATGLTTSMPATTPVVWTRGLRTDGTWDPQNGVYGSDGGIVGFLGGNVLFVRDLRSQPLAKPGGGSTSNILETLPAGARVVGSGPGTLNGQAGLATNGGSVSR